jgi:MFS family permease
VFIILFSAACRQYQADTCVDSWFGVISSIVPSRALMRQETPVELIGRVSSSFMSVLSVSQLLGLIISGSLAQTLGIRSLFLASAAMLVLFALLGYFRLPKQAPATA